MKKLIGLLVIMVIGLTSCDNQQTISDTVDNKPIVDKKIDFKAEMGKLNDFLKKYEEPSQTFKISASKPVQVKGKQGTIISVNPADLITKSGQPLGKNIEVELKELSNQDQLLRANAQTVSNGQLLVSGGAYYINMTSDGQQLKLKTGKNLKVEFPKLSDDTMNLFYGQRDSLGKMNWSLVEGEKFKIKDDKLKPSKTKPNKPKATAFLVSNRYTRAQTDSIHTVMNDNMRDTSFRTMTKEEKEKYDRENKLYKKVYAAINISSFGWINCDRFPDIKNKTDLFVKFNSIDSVYTAEIYLVFKDINSVMQSYYVSYRNNTINDGFVNIPVGCKVRLVAYTIKKEKVYSYSSDLTIADKQTITLAMKETNEQNFKKIIGKN